MKLFSKRKKCLQRLRLTNAITVDFLESEPSISKRVMKLLGNRLVYRKAVKSLCNA